MSILINKNTRVVTQGITGKTGQFHTRVCREYANGARALSPASIQKRPVKISKVSRSLARSGKQRNKPAPTFP